MSTTDVTPRMRCPECHTDSVRASNGIWECGSCGAAWCRNPCAREMLLDAFPQFPPGPHPYGSLSDRPRRRGGLHLGYWANDRYPQLPYPADFVDHNWKKQERQVVVEYLRAGETKTQWRGGSYCRMCDLKRSKAMGSTCLTDGTYTWPWGFAHYVEEHGVRPPQEFIDHVREAIQGKQGT